MTQVTGWMSVVLACAVIVGCESQQGAPTNHEHLQWVADGYGLFLKHNRRLPQDDAEFREFITKLAADDPQTQGQTIDQLLTSPRDGKTYGLITAEDATPTGATTAVFEQDGVDGRRLVADTAGNVQEVDEAKFRTIVPSSQNVTVEEAID